MDHTSPHGSWFDLMRALDANDLGAFVCVRQLIASQLRMMCRRRPWPLDFDDLVQDTLLSLIRAWRKEQIRNEEGFRGFVWRLAHRRLADACANVRRLPSPDAEAERHPAPHAASAEYESRQHDLSLDVLRGLEQLAPGPRRALEAIYLAGMGYQEAAAQLGVPLGTLKRWQTASLREMRSWLMTSAKDARDSRRDRASTTARHELQLLRLLSERSRVERSRTSTAGCRPECELELSKTVAIPAA